MKRISKLLFFGTMLWALQASLQAQETRQTVQFDQIKSYLDSVPAIDTHDHLWPFDQLPGYVQTQYGKGMNLFGIWRSSYYTWYNPLTNWQPGMSFRDWWSQSKNDFVNARATSFYRYQLPAFRDLYGVDFEGMTDAEAEKLDRKIFDNYQNQDWLREVITERANIELMFNDPYWARFRFQNDYPFSVFVFNVTTLVRSFHPTEFTSPDDDPYVFAEKNQLSMESFDGLLEVIDRLFDKAKKHGAVCLKTTLAYQRTLSFEKVSRGNAPPHLRREGASTERWRTQVWPIPCS